MKRNVVAVVESSIGPRLLLATHLRRLGYAVAAVSRADALAEQVDAGTLDWLILDETVARRDRDGMLRRLARQGRPPRIVWLGSSPRLARLPIEARFDKPLDYAEIIAFFSAHAVGDPRT